MAGRNLDLFGVAPTSVTLDRGPLLADETRRQKPYKRQRQTAREAYRQQRASDRARAQVGKETRQGQVLRCLAAYWNAHQESPTALELLEWMKLRGERVEDVNDVRPKIFYLCKKGIVEPGSTRKCRKSGKRVHTWRVVEAGVGCRP